MGSLLYIDGTGLISLLREGRRNWCSEQVEFSKNNDSCCQRIVTIVLNSLPHSEPMFSAALLLRQLLIIR